jgi:hypothetical protein
MGDSKGVLRHASIENQRVNIDTMDSTWISHRRLLGLTSKQEAYRRGANCPLSPKRLDSELEKAMTLARW